MYDLVIIGGGINGAGIARDAAGRGLSVLLIEKDDIAQATSSASTKLIHGGLRYLEQYDFKLVAESLAEREVLLASAPHIIHPLKFILPHEPHLRPKWMIRLGLYLYDKLAKRSTLPRSQALKFNHDHDVSAPLKDQYKYGFSYSDCWVDDARLVLLCAKDAQEKGAEIRTRTLCTKTQVSNDKAHWIVDLKDTITGKEDQVQAQCVVNATGPWARKFLDANDLARDKTFHVRHSKGSHIIVPKLYDGQHAYLLQQPDGRIVFAISYEKDYTVIGTTDAELDSDLDHVEISEAEITYLCAAASRSFKTAVTPDMIVSTYSGVRGLLDSGDDDLSAVTRDYKLDLETAWGPPLLNIFGGKLTTFRILSQHAVDLVAPKTQPWTQDAVLPGGDIPQHDFAGFIERQCQKYPCIDHALIVRYARAYGQRMDDILQGVTSLGMRHADGIYEAELRYAVRAEWVKTADDFLWRRSKLGLHISDKDRSAIEQAIATYLAEETPA